MLSHIEANRTAMQQVLAELLGAFMYVDKASLRQENVNAAVNNGLEFVLLGRFREAAEVFDYAFKAFPELQPHMANWREISLLARYAISMLNLGKLEEACRCVHLLFDLVEPLYRDDREKDACVFEETNAVTSIALARNQAVARSNYPN